LLFDFESNTWVQTLYSKIKKTLNNKQRKTVMPDILKASYLVLKNHTLKNFYMG